jgi:hypothetical protein
MASATRIPPTPVSRLEIAGGAPAPVANPAPAPRPLVAKEQPPPVKAPLAAAAGAAWQPVVRGASPTPVVPTSAPAPDKTAAVNQPVAPVAPIAPIAAANTSAVVTPNVPQPRQTSGTEKLRELHRGAAARHDAIKDYTARFRIMEWINGKMEQHTVQFWFAKNPFSVRFKWAPDSTHAGREIVYVMGKYGNQLQVLTGRSDPISGMRVAVDPNSERATKNSRRTITEAGLGNLIDRFGQILTTQEAGTPTYGTLQYLGPQKRPESAVPMECAVQKVPPRLEKHLPRGGHRYFFFNADAKAREHQLPVLVVTVDENGKQVEYYCYDQLAMNVSLSANDFEPNVIWSRR